MIDRVLAIVLVLCATGLLWVIHGQIEYARWLKENKCELASKAPTGAHRFVGKVSRPEVMRIYQCNGFQHKEIGT